MSEVEFDRLLDAVRTAIAPEDEFMAHPSSSIRSPKAANDNQHVWGFIPLPEGWNAVC